MGGCLVFVLGSCDSYFRKDPEHKPLARVGDNFLYHEDIANLVGKNLSPADSAFFVNNYIDDWAVHQLLMAKAKINLPEEKLNEFDRLVSQYRNDLYTGAYKDALVQQSLDTAIASSELHGFYDREKENFKLREKLVRLRFVEFSPQFLDRDGVTQRFKRFNEDDAAYMDSIRVQFKKLHFNDSIWVPVNRVMQEIRPLTPDNEERYLKNTQFFELEDSTSVFLGKVDQVLDVNDIAPFQYIEPTLKQVILNKRKQDFVRKMETDILDEAVKEKEFEIYEKKD